MIIGLKYFSDNGVMFLKVHIELKDYKFNVGSKFNK